MTSEAGTPKEPRTRTGRDPGWDRLAETIADELAANAAATNGPLPPSTQADLAKALALQSSEIRNWLRGAKNPRFELIPDIAVALAASYDAPDQRAREVLQRLAAALFDKTRDAAEMAFAVHRLQTRLIEMRQDIAHIADSAGVPAIAARALKTGWALAIWPAFEGPPGGPILHVVDRVDFRRVDGTAATDDAVWAEFGTLLRQVGASRSTSEWSAPRWVEYKRDRTVSGWVVPRVGAPHSSTIQNAWSNLTAVSIVSTSSHGWGNDVASHLADAIGYGMTTTDDMMMDVYGLAAGEDARTKRNQLQEWLTQRPPSKRVWSHTSYSDPLQSFRSRAIAPGLLVVWQHESDRHLQLAAEQSALDPVTGVIDESAWAAEQEKLLSARALGDELAASTDGVLRVDVQLPDMDGMSIAHQRAYRWEQCFANTLQCLQHLIDTKRIPGKDLARWWEESGKIGTGTRESTIRAWFASRVQI